MFFVKSLLKVGQYHSVDGDRHPVVLVHRFRIFEFTVSVEQTKMFCTTFRICSVLQKPTHMRRSCKHGGLTASWQKGLSSRTPMLSLLAANHRLLLQALSRHGLSSVWGVQCSHPHQHGVLRRHNLSQSGCVSRKSLCFICIFLMTHDVEQLVTCNFFPEMSWSQQWLRARLSQSQLLTPCRAAPLAECLLSGSPAATRGQEMLC